MPRYSLLGHLVRQFVGAEENVATEGLNYILSRSTVGRHALIHLIAQTDELDLGDDLAFQTQALGKDGAMPDLVGFDYQKQPRLIIEAKFWAGLTDRQPVTYIQSLPSDDPGVVVFLAPVQRLPLLWAELVERCRNEGLTEAGAPTSGADPCSIRLRGQRALILVSWQRLLGVVVRELEAAGETELASDAHQLLGLCEQMDGSSFGSVAPEEAGSQGAEGVSQYEPLIELIVHHMATEGIGTFQGKRTSRGEDWRGCYLEVAPYLLLVSVDVRHRTHYANTPFWLSLYRRSGRPLRKSDRVKVPQPCLFVKDQFGKDHCLVPLFAPDGEQDEVARELAAQVAQVARYLRER